MTAAAAEGCRTLSTHVPGSPGHYGSVRGNCWARGPQASSGVLVIVGNGPPSTEPLQVVVEPSRRDTAEWPEPAPELPSDQEYLSGKEAPGVLPVSDAQTTAEVRERAARSSAPDDRGDVPEPASDSRVVVAGA